MKWAGRLLFCTFFLHPLSVWATNPGFKTKITTKGIDYGCKMMMSVLRNRLIDVRIPDISGDKQSKVLQELQYNISSITISKVNFPDTSVNLVSNVGLKVAFSLGYIEMSGNWYIKSKILRAHGKVKAQINSIATSIFLRFGKDDAGRPTMFIMDCSSYIAKLQVHVFGKSSWLYNLIIRWFEPSIRKYLSGKICFELKKILNEKIYPFLRTVPVTKEVGRYIGIDYSLTSPPFVTNNSLNLPLKGEFYNLLHRTDIPFSAPALNIFSGHERMLYIGISEYFFNSAGYVLNSVGGISINITDDMLPDNSRIRFNTETIGTLIPQMKKMYPVMKMKLQLIADSAPSMAFQSDKIILTTSGDVYAFAILPNSTLIPLFNVKLKAQITTPVGIKDDKITGKLTLDRVELSLQKSNIGPFQVNCLQSGIDFLISIVILPRINTDLAKGYSLPLMDHIKLSNLILQPHKNFLMFATDITYY
ncbi:bactericidal permeability-increasing protein-like isoform X1 [Amblyraja radiata]|uniref:bactericidal permeability-increasing protein-like isoform X1 n=2 Tax=Amblyraja radiata TaxID=386614 RepID=UPI001401EE71|nr:bactericidal permeability-increasing protein-like isoform X1 [Amblyraja radiata]